MSNPSESGKLLGITCAPIKGFAGTSLANAEYLLAFFALIEGLILGLYFGEGFMLVMWCGICFIVVSGAAKTYNKSLASGAYYCFVVNLLLHFWALITLSWHWLTYGGGIFIFPVYLYIAAATISTMVGTYVAWSFNFRVQRDQHAILTGNASDKDHPLAEQSN